MWVYGLWYSKLSELMGSDLLTKFRFPSTRLGAGQGISGCRKAIDFLGFLHCKRVLDPNDRILEMF